MESLEWKIPETPKVETEKNSVASEPELPKETIAVDGNFFNNEEIRQEEKINEAGEDKENGNETRIPPKIYDRLIAKVLKSIARETEPVKDTRAILAEMGLKGDEEFFARMVEEADFLKTIGSKTANMRNRAIEEEQRKTDEEISQKRDIKYGKGIETDSGREWVVKRNLADSKWMSEVKGFIKRNQGNPRIIDTFWMKFDNMFTERKKNTDSRLNLNDAEGIRSGILGEVCAEKLLWKMNRQSDLYEKLEVGLEDLRFSVEEATTEQDVLQQTDMILNVTYKEKTYKLPVQVKSSYLPNATHAGQDFLKNNICSFSQPFVKIDRDKERRDIKPEAQDRLNLKRMKFFSYHKHGGIFIIVPYGLEELEVSLDGTPSPKLEKLFYDQLIKRLNIFIKRIDNIEEYESRRNNSA